MNADETLFANLENGDVFWVYGDIHLNYDYPKICLCEKVDHKTFKEKSTGVKFLMNWGAIVRTDINNDTL